MKVSQFLLTATTCGGLLAGLLHFAQPTDWFAPSSATAVVEVRVVPRFAPTAASVRQSILSETFLNSAWHRFHDVGTSITEPTDAETPEAAAERQAQLKRWRERVDVEIEPHFVDDQRQIRIHCEAGDDVASAEDLVQFLAVRYAGELAATRWYDAVDRLRISQQQYKSSGDELLTIVHQAIAANKSAGTQPSTGATMEVRTVAAVSDDSGAPRLIAPNQDASPAFDARSSNAGRTPVKAAPLVAQSPAEPTSIAGPATAKLVQAERQFLSAGGAMERQLTEMLAPQSAEFPVVATEIAGRHLGHVQGFWYAVAALAGLIVAAGAEWLRAKNASRGNATIGAAPAHPLSRNLEPEAAAATVELPPPPAVIRTPEDAARAVRAPLIGVVRRHAG